VGLGVVGDAFFSILSKIMDLEIVLETLGDALSCGLWMINYMEYWTEITLSDHVT
jgi:hypothetical protein